ncbi:MAG: hypothetical protein RIC55_07925 [Pirellulaceae bacterium]
MTRKGACHLCGQVKSLQNSHVVPRFGYKRYVANHARGGRFVDLEAGYAHNRQLKRYWFCKSCEGQFAETHAGTFLSNVDSSPNEGSYPYSGDLLRFAVSLSWRCAKYNKPATQSHPDRGLLTRPMRYWKDFLRQRKLSPNPYSQHAFIAFGENIPEINAEWKQTMGNQIFPEERIVFSRIGPMVVFGFLDKRHLNRTERRICEGSELSCASGVVFSIHKGRRESLLTEGMARVLDNVELRCIKRSSRVKGR